MGLVEEVAQYEAKRTNKSFEEVIAEYYEQEHADAVLYAKEDYKGWIDLIIWDFLMIQDAYKELNKINNFREYLYYINFLCRCFKFLHEDIELLNNQNVRKNIKIVDVPESNWQLVKLIGYIEETNVILSEQFPLIQLKQNFTIVINKIKAIVNNFVTNTNAKNVNDYILAEETWNKLPQKRKNQILYELEDIEPEEGPDTECLKA